MMIRVSLVLLLLALSHLAGGSLAAASAEDAMTVAAPSKVQGGAGDTFALDIATGSTEEIGAFQFTMSFDDDVLSLADASPAEHFSDAGSVFCPPPSLQPDEVTFGCSIIGGDFVEGPTALAQLVFQFDQATEGTLTFGLEGCLLAGPLGNALGVGGCKGTQVLVNAPPPPVQLTLSPAAAKVQATPGQTMTLDAVVSTASEIGGFDMQVLYDSTKLNLTSITMGALLAGGGDFQCVLDPPPGFNFDVACFKFSEEGAATGSGVGVHLNFTVKAPFSGATDISLDSCHAADEQLSPIPVDVCGSAIVQGNPPPPAVGGLAIDTSRRAATQSYVLAAALALCVGGLAIATALVRRP